MKGAFFVTGTDTGVGKSRATAALLHEAVRRGLRAVGMKPVSAGGDEDIEALRAAGNLAVAPELDNPYRLPLPVSPHIAAARAGAVIEPALVKERLAQLRAQADTVFVEGAGGFEVPISPELTGGDLAAALGLPVILVVGLRLGCLNHALLTRAAIAARGLPLAGWIANHVDPEMAEPEANLEYLARHLRAPCLARWAWSPPTPAQALKVNWR